MSARPRPAEHAPQHREAADRLDVGDPVLVVGDPHRPGEDRALAFGVEGGDPLELAPGDAACGFEVGPGVILDPVPPGVPAFAVVSDE